MRKLSVFLVIFVMGVVFLMGGHAFAFSKIVAFGDSLSDNGNADGYGFGRWSNGPVWLDYLAAEMGAQLEDRALGGAKTSGHNSGSSLYGLDWQVDLYVVQTGPGTDLSNVLFVIWAGGNDFLTMQPTDDPALVIANAINNIQGAMDDLLAIGAKNILVMSLPDLGEAPLNNWDPVRSANASALSRVFNQYLVMMLCNYLNFLPDHRFYYVDTYELLDFIVANPAPFGFTNVTSSGNQTPPPGYLFWDPIHPTTAAHRVVAAAACGQVWHHNLSKSMRELLRKLNTLRPRQPLEYECDLLNPVAP